MASYGCCSGACRVTTAGQPGVCGSKACSEANESCTVQTDCCYGNYCQTHDGAPGHLKCQPCRHQGEQCWTGHHCCSGQCSSGQPGHCQ